MVSLPADKTCAGPSAYDAYCILSKSHVDMHCSSSVPYRLSHCEWVVSRGKVSELISTVDGAESSFVRIDNLASACVLSWNWQLLAYRFVQTSVQALMQAEMRAVIKGLMRHMCRQL